jgi:hypothetical protein
MEGVTSDAEGIISRQSYCDGSESIGQKLIPAAVEKDGIRLMSLLSRIDLSSSMLVDKIRC